MRKLLLLLATLAMSAIANSNLYAQTVNECITNIQAKEKEFKEEEAFVIAQAAVRKYPKNVQLLCKASVLASKVGNRKSTNAERKTAFTTAKVLAQQAVKIEPKNATCNLVLAIAMGRMALIGSINEKVAASRDIQKYSTLAVQLDPKLSMAWHVLGRYNYEVSQLSALEKKAAQTLMGGLPEGDLKTAISCFEKCYALDKTYITNLIDLAKAYIKAKRTADAKKILGEIATAPRRFTDDLKFKEEAATLLKTLK
jgi:tetratricopeptide (TPR) repeat protein